MLITTAVTEEIPCDEIGGQLEEFCSGWFTPWCTPYKTCVCKDGFTGDACELSEEIPFDENGSQIEELPEEIPCDENGGQIEELCYTPWFTDECTPYKACVCKNGFIGDACEHDCKNTMCTRIFEPVCAGTDTMGVDVAFDNICEFHAAQCERSDLHFLYDGECQDENLCPDYHCPADCSVVYKEDPNNSHCKICECDPDTYDYDDYNSDF